ncbi:MULTISPECIES: helix-turn-helix domain-containing protein [unclassified Streptomyces]|uniref:helix-turn-helix domain-containing protein n=2 Tax=Streptomyces TaxID=1883 RepID=UPI0035D84D29
MSARFLYQSGGVRLTPQQRSELHLTSSEREEISQGIAAGEPVRQLARRLGGISHRGRAGPPCPAAAAAQTSGGAELVGVAAAPFHPLRVVQEASGSATPAPSRNTTRSWSL